MEDATATSIEATSTDKGAALGFTQSCPEITRRIGFSEPVHQSSSVHVLDDESGYEVKEGHDKEKEHEHHVKIATGKYGENPREAFHRNRTKSAPTMYNLGTRKLPEYEVAFIARSSGSGTRLLPDELLIQVFKWLDIRALSQAGLVCTDWQLVSRDCIGLCELNIERNTAACKWLLTTLLQVIDLLMQDQVISLKTPPEPINEAAPSTRLSFIKETSVLLETYLDKQDVKDPAISTPEYAHILAILNKQILDTKSVLYRIYKGQAAMNEHFDIFELTLRRYYSQFTHMFSLPGKKKWEHPSMHIHDPKARKVWEDKIGKHEYLCDFSTFCDAVVADKTIASRSARKTKELKYYLAYFLNFPQDNTVTTYKWDILTRLFGPYEDFYSNFSKYVLGQGFLGLTNRIRAEELLSDYPGTVLIRFSRTSPTLLAFSCSHRGKFYHSTNHPNLYKAHNFEPPPNAPNFPISILLELDYFAKGLTLIPLRVDGKAVAKAKTLSDYVDQDGGYYTALQM